VSANKRLYLFQEGNKDMRDLLGGKGANLAEMTNAGLPVPPGFTITTEACIEYQRAKALPDGLMDDVRQAIAVVEKATGKKFGDPKNPLLVSVRSGAKFSMPGMMDTVLNLGLNEQTLEGLVTLTRNRRFALDAYRRLLMMFGDVVLGIERPLFDREFNKTKERLGVRSDTEVGAEALEELTRVFKKIIREHTGREFPQDPWEQLRLALIAVFDSWGNPRAVEYRNLNRISHDLGTAVNVQTMVFGNTGDRSGTGVAFTRDPSTGEKVLYGDYLTNAQGEDVVAGVRTPMHISEMGRVLPEVYDQFVKICDMLEKHYREMMDLEFTVDNGVLYMLQARVGKRTAPAAVRIAVDMVNEGLIGREEAVQRVDPEQLDQLMHPQIDPKAKLQVLAVGLPASPGAASGRAVFSADEAAERGKAGERIVLVREETTPDDIHGLAAAQGVLTSRGGMTSHAAVVARGMGKPCVAGCESIRVDVERKQFSANETVVKHGDIVTIDGSTGRVILGEVPMIAPRMGGDFKTLLEWADGFRRLGVHTNADTPQDARTAYEFGAQGIGLCRTEHMFMAQDRLPVVQEMIVASDAKARAAPLAKLLPMQRGDFEALFREMKGYPVTIRLLDPPLHEFLPRWDELMEEVIELRLRDPRSPVLKEKEDMLAMVNSLREANPMLGLRGCRLGITRPEINEMQVRAIFEAACNVAKQGLPVKPEVMIPLVGHVNELKLVREQLEKVARQVMTEAGIEIEYKFGTMVEIPRAALTADQVAEYAEFFSFGTNDLTQTVFGFSRDDAEGKFIHVYLDKKILPDNPFETLDPDGVGQLMRIGVEKGRAARPDLKIGICGEHGGDPRSIDICEELGLDYVSCSPYRVPVARLAAAHASLRRRRAAAERDV
jgi:pyruvate,orthophosphate dikinase